MEEDGRRERPGAAGAVSLYGCDSSPDGDGVRILRGVGREAPGAGVPQHLRYGEERLAQELGQWWGQGEPEGLAPQPSALTSRGPDEGPDDAALWRWGARSSAGAASRAAQSVCKALRGLHGLGAGLGPGSFTVGA